MLKIVLQDGIKDCGICCLLSVIRFYGGEVSKEYLRKLTNTTKDGVSAYNLIEAAKCLGMDSYGASGDLSNIEFNNLPCIAHIHINSNYDHFVVIYNINKKDIIIMDPSIGKRILRINEFKLMSTNNYIFLKPKKKLPIINTKKQLYKKLSSHFKINKYKYLILTFLTINSMTLELLLAFNFKYILNFSINYNYSYNIIIISLLLITINILNAAIHFVNHTLLSKILLNLDSNITQSTFKQLLLLPYFYYKNRTTGEILSRFNDLSTIKNFLVSILSFFITDLFSIIIFLIIISRISIKLTKYIILYLLLILLFLLFRSKKKRKLFKDIKVGNDHINSYIVDAISNVDTTKGSHLEKRFSDKFYLKYRKYLESNYYYTKYNNINSLVLEFLYYLLIIIIYGLGGYLVIEEKLKLIDLIIYQSFFQYLLKSFSHVLNILEELHNFIICLERVEDLYSIREEKFSKSYYYRNYKLLGDIKINNLNYSINNKVIFKNLNLLINLGDKVLLFGSSGSGKSTLVKMLLRYIEVPYKVIKIDNIDINHYHLENIRKYITYSTANELIFNDSIYNNITLYKDISENDFLKVIKITRVNQIFGDDFNNYKNIIEENGFLLSNGERQRIILARSILRDSSIYIFDESFSGIDIDLTNKIIKDMFLYLKDKTVIVISHRQNSKKYFNRIIKLNNGELNEK